MNALQAERYIDTDRLTERRKEIYRRLEQLTRKPQNEWNVRERNEISQLMKRLIPLIV